MALLDIKPDGSGEHDLVALGEIMLRLNPGEGRVPTAREFLTEESVFCPLDMLMSYL